MDIVSIKNLEIFANHGVYQSEKDQGQIFIISVDMYMSTRKAGLSDDLNDAVNYGEVSYLINTITTAKSYDLLEKLSEVIAHEILVKYPAVHKVRVKVDKPGAPIKLKFDTVSVEIERARHIAYIALGSNMGDKKKYIKDAIKALGKACDCKVITTSSLIKTEPYGGVEQDEFLNGVLKLETLLTPDELLDVLHEIEAAANRERLIHWGPRTLDLDIIFYDNEIIDTETLHVPHIDMHNRDFVLVPMREIAPYFRHPLLNKTMEQLCTEMGF